MKLADTRQRSTRLPIAPFLLPISLTIALGLMGCKQHIAVPASWNQVAKLTAWIPRDSCGEVVFRGKMWLLGGWWSSYENTPRDIWSSADGITWHEVMQVAPWRHGDLPTTMVFRNRIWIMGGWHGGRLPGASAGNEVWSSRDGANWTAVTKNAAWSPRLGAAGVVFKGKMWLLGGVGRYYDGNDELKNDVWCSADGADWKLVTHEAPWAPRAYHAAVVHHNRLWILGGGNYVPGYCALNDVWSSPDGEHWTRVTDMAPWPPRIWFSSLVYRDRIWVLGGWSSNPVRNWNDVWYSKDGQSWKQLNLTTTWSPRHEHSAFVFKDKIWIAGGSPPLQNDVWALDVPNAWGDEK